MSLSRIRWARNGARLRRPSTVRIANVVSSHANLIVEQGARPPWTCSSHASNVAMPRMIQLRHVPDDLHRTLKARAALEGLSLSDYLLREVRPIAERPTLDELRRRLAGRAPVAGASPATLWPNSSSPSSWFGRRERAGLKARRRPRRPRGCSPRHQNQDVRGRPSRILTWQGGSCHHRGNVGRRRGPTR
jgi:antitoxin FitA